MSRPAGALHYSWLADFRNFNEMIKRYLLNLDYINFEVCKGRNKYSLVIKFEPDRYRVNKLQKDFSYDEYPSEDEMKNLLKALFFKSL